MKTIGPMTAQVGNTEIAVVFSVDPQKFHKILMAGGEDGLDEAINKYITEEIVAIRGLLFTDIRDLVIIRQTQLEATSR